MKILYIAGSTRSGSTLLERCLACNDGYFSLGEMRYFWRRAAANNELCGCGQKFSQCEFWADIVKQAGNINRDNRMADDIDMLTSPRRSLYGLLFSRKKYFHTRNRVTANLEIFYSILSNKLGDVVMIDNSKDPLYLLLLKNIHTIDMHIVHLVRDARGAAYSWTAKKVRGRPDGEYMSQFHPAYSAMHWVYTNLTTSWLMLRSHKMTRLRYEDLATAAKPSTMRILNALSLPFDSSSPLFPDQKKYAMRYHPAAGNPDRLNKTQEAFREDVRWKSSMRPVDFIVTTLISLPLLLAYGYKIKR